ncbi:hypothetical protein EYF80_062292 [Liparis tanakae]|uniref:Uncharacterized protein n=1 Tax=Liparis tanakae TaxID=230148 RepID=A0A4Z2EFM2_9TELE|nr:hypothetical protein EYF80_062292 [Liparis tanakae]
MSRSGADGRGPTPLLAEDWHPLLRENGETETRHGGCDAVVSVAMDPRSCHRYKTHNRFLFCVTVSRLCLSMKAADTVTQ